MENNKQQNNQNKGATQSTVVAPKNDQKVIKFVPDRPSMKLRRGTIIGALNANLRTLVPGFEGARLEIKNCSIAIQIALRPTDVMFKKDVVGNIFDGYDESKSKYKLTQEGISKLSDFITTNAEIPVEVVRKGKMVYIIVSLNPLKTIEKILEPAPQGYDYVIDAIENTTKDKGSITLALQKKRTPKKRNNKR